MPHRLNIDIESYSDIDLSKAGLYKYVQSSAFRVMLIAYSIDGAPPELLDLTDPGRGDADRWATFVRMLFDPLYTKHAFNAAFEIAALGRLCNQDLPEEQWECTMIHAAYCGFPQSLKMCAKALGLPTNAQKDDQGDSLIKYFCKPCKPTKANGGRERNLPHHDLDRWALFQAYNRQDVVAEMAVEDKLAGFPVPDFVQAEWRQDIRIARRGVGVDRVLVQGAVALKDTLKQDVQGEICRLTGVRNPNSLPQLKAWLERRLGHPVSSLDKVAVQELQDTCTDPDVLALLDLRGSSGKSSLAKYDALEKSVCDDGRARGVLRFYGASRTGRWSGQLAQLQNLPRTYLSALPQAREMVRARKREHLQFCYGSVASSLSQLIRTTFVPAPGMLFVDADFSAIEARVLAWLAGEEWVLEVFRGHGKIYEACAAQMFGVPLDSVDGGLRQKGKVATLALGYAGSTGALRKMGAVRDGIPESDLYDIVRRWRTANPNIKRFWYAVNNAAIAATECGETTRVGHITIGRALDAQRGVDQLFVTLPSGRSLFYPLPRMVINKYEKPAVGFMSARKGGFLLEDTYGGKLVENITQAIARDCLAHVMREIEHRGYSIVFHVHDEVICEVPEAQAEQALNTICTIMSTPISWALGLPLNAEGWIGSFYTKG
jgi:DNA polymerase